jgi:hypothetical protein
MYVYVNIFFSKYVYCMYTQYNNVQINIPPMHEFTYTRTCLVQYTPEPRFHNYFSLSFL